MDDKIDIIKFFVILFSPFIALKFLEDADYIYALFCIIPWLTLICHQCGRLGNYIEDKFQNPYQYNYTSNIYWEKNEKDKKKFITELSEKCVINKNVIKMETLEKPTVTTPLLPPIKEIVAKELEKKSEKILDGTKINKPIIDMDKLTTPPPLPNVVTTTTNTTAMSSFVKEAILVENNKDMSNEKMGTYKTIISVLENKENLLADKKYALYQSFAYIDVNKEGIVLYIDYDILKKAGLTKEQLHQEDIVKALRTAMHCEQLMVIFDEYKPKNLLNYFLETKCYDAKC